MFTLCVNKFELRKKLLSSTGEVKGSVLRPTGRAADLTKRRRTDTHTKEYTSFSDEDKKEVSASLVRLLKHQKDGSLTIDTLKAELRSVAIDQNKPSVARVVLAYLISEDDIATQVETGKSAANVEKMRGLHAWSKENLEAEVAGKSSTELLEDWVPAVQTAHDDGEDHEERAETGPKTFTTITYAGKPVRVDDFTAEELDKVPVTLEVMRTLVCFNLRIPLGFLIVRRHIVFEAGMYVALKKGKETGVIYTSRTQVELVRNGKQRKIGVNLNFSAKTVIKVRRLSPPLVINMLAPYLV